MLLAHLLLDVGLVFLNPLLYLVLSDDELLLDLPLNACFEALICTDLFLVIEKLLIWLLVVDDRVVLQHLLDDLWVFFTDNV